MSDIAERLRWLSSRHAEHMDDGPRLTDFCHAGREAADEIDRLRADWETARDAHDRRTAEVVRLRAALREIAKYRIEEGCPCSACEHSAIARAALGEKP